MFNPRYRLRHRHRVSSQIPNNKKSFLPTTISEWNAFPIDIQNLETLRASNNLLDREKPQPNRLFFFGRQKSSCYTH